MDRSGYEAPSRTHPSEYHGIAYSNVQPRAALRGPRSIREPATARVSKSGTGAYGNWFAMISIALGVGLILARMRAVRDAYAVRTIALPSRRRSL